MCQFGSPEVLQWSAELHPMGARMERYIAMFTLLGVISTRSQQVLKE